MDLEILKIASFTENNKNISNHTHFSKLKNSMCGDEIQIKLIIKKDKIVDFGYQGNACIYCQASASLLSKMSINQKKMKINKLCDEVELYLKGNNKNSKNKCSSFKKLFKQKNLSRKDCILLPFRALKKILVSKI
jgi:nitrogen fixation NifU-like protein